MALDCFFFLLLKVWRPSLLALRTSQSLWKVCEKVGESHWSHVILPEDLPSTQLKVTSSDNGTFQANCVRERKTAKKKLKWKTFKNPQLFTVGSERKCCKGITVLTMLDYFLTSRQQKDLKVLYCVPYRIILELFHVLVWMNKKIINHFIFMNATYFAYVCGCLFLKVRCVMVALTNSYINI